MKRNITSLNKSYQRQAAILTLDLEQKKVCIRKKNKVLQNGCQTVLKVFDIFGLSFDSTRKCTNRVYIFLQCLLVLYMHGTLSLYLARILQFILYKRKFMKSAISLLISLSINLFLWILTFWKRKDIASLVKAIYKLGINRQKLRWTTRYLFPTLAISNFFTPLVTYLIYSNRQDLQAMNVVITYGPSIATQVDGFGLTSFVFYAYACSVHCFLDLMQNLLTLLCSWMFLEMRQALEQCQDMLLFPNPSEGLYRLYYSVFRFKCSMESVLGPTVLLLSVSGFLTIFTSLSGILGENNGEFTSQEMILNALSHMIVRMVYLICLVFSAAEVSEKDKAFRRAVVSYSLIKKHNNLNPMFLASIDDVTALSFSVCGYFELTRGFVASAIGILLTYTMLFLQIEKKDNK